jgi:uncharacterized membrane protein YadS
VHQVFHSTAQLQPTFTTFGHATSIFDSQDALITQLSKLVQQLRTTLPFSSVVALAYSSNVACVVNSSPS